MTKKRWLSVTKLKAAVVVALDGHLACLADEKKKNSRPRLEEALEYWQRAPQIPFSPLRSALYHLEQHLRGSCLFPALEAVPQQHTAFAAAV